MKLTDFMFGLTTGDLIHDIETYPNIFTIGFIHADTGNKYIFEISSRKNQLNEFILFIHVCQALNIRWVGFNNIGFDYPVIHFIDKNKTVGLNVEHIYEKAMSIINAPFNAKFSHLVWESDWLVPQIDLFKIHHFDNQARSTSLKVLEFNMGMTSIEDLPFDVGLNLTDEQCDVLIDYMWHDLDATLMFYHESKDQIRFREELTVKYGKNFMNHNDTKIGKDYFIMELEKANPGCCYKYIDGKKHIQQTPRDSINLGDVILPYIKFNHPEFQRIHEWFNNKTITETKGAIKDVNCTIDGFQFDFGTGGIHGSIESQIVTSDDDYMIEDWDVASYYPNLAIVNKLAPAHLGETFCTIYKDVYEQRKGHAKGTAENAMLKLALNGVYGDSNSKFSPFYDPAFTMAITINGQLSLCMLAEALMQSPQVKMIQINTDGLTIRYPRALKSWVHTVCQWWQDLTQLVLEDVEYSRMFIRDVNNYIGEYTDGKLKRKGAYEYDLGWHQNHSAKVVAKAAEAALVHGEDIRQTILHHDNIMDFMCLAKVPRSNRLMWGDEQIQNTSRYYVSTDGDMLKKIMPASGPVGEYKRATKLTDEYYNSVMAEIGTGVWDERIHTKSKTKYEQREQDINTGYTVMIANRLPEVFSRVMSEEFDGDGGDIADYQDAVEEIKSLINYEWYIKQAEKLVNPLLRNV
jgi:hypothetical protein